MTTENGNDVDDVARAAAEVLATGIASEARAVIAETAAGGIEAVARKHGLNVSEPLRPELRPGESVTTVPDRFCEQCREPRGGRRCHMCRAITVLRLEQDEPAEEYTKPPFVRERDLQARARQTSRPPARFSRQPEPPLEDEDEDDEDDELEEAEELEREEPQRMVANARPQRFSAPPRREQDRRERGSNNRGAGNMARQHQQQRRLRSVDYEEQVTPTRRGAGGRRGGRDMSAEEQLSRQWVNGQVDTVLWYQGFATLLAGADSVDDVGRAAELADAAYIEMMARQNAG